MNYPFTTHANRPVSTRIRDYYVMWGFLYGVLLINESQKTYLSPFS